MAAAEEDQQSPAQQTSNNDELFTPPDQNEPTVKVEEGLMSKFKRGEKINLLSDDEGNDDIAGAFAAQAPPFRPSVKKEPTKGQQPAGSVSQSGPDMQGTDRESTAHPPIFDAETLRQMAIRKQREYAAKFREKHAVQQPASDSDGIQDDVRDADRTIPESNGHSKPSNGARGKDEAATQFKKIKRAYLKKKAANALSMQDEVDFLKAESNESARLRKQEADEAFDRSPSPDNDDDDGLFVKEAPVGACYSAMYSDDEELVKPKKAGRKRPPPKDGENDAPRKRNKHDKSAKKGSKVVGTDYTTGEFKDVMNKAKSKKGIKGTKQKTNAKTPKTLGTTMTNVDSLMGSNVFLDTAAVAELPDQPTIEQTGGYRTDALKKLLASVPTDSKEAAGVDKRALDAACSAFTGRGSVAPAKDGWSLKGMRSTLKHYQVLGGAFMRQRETLNEKPNGGILADEMGLGKTVEMLANITNGKQLEKGGPRTTLIVASPALVTQWAEEIRKHCQSRRENKIHGLGKVLQHRAGSRIKGNDTEDTLETLQEADIVLTTYHEVCRSYPKAEVPADLQTAKQKDLWWREFYSEHRDVLHRVNWLRVVLDEAQAIKNHRSHTSMACRALSAHHYWAITGTPIQNTIKEFYPYFKFIREANTGSYKQFKENFASPDDPDGREKLNIFLRMVMIRRTHGTKLFEAKLLNLPRPHEHTVWLEFSEIERQVYEIVKKRFIQRINTIAKEKSLEKQYGHIWTMILRLRQICSHILLIQGTVVDLLEREDLEKLNSLTADEDDMAGEGSTLLVHLRNVLKTSKNVKTIEGGIGSSVLTEHEILPNGVIDIDDVDKSAIGGRHGLSFRMRRYLDSLVQSEHWEEITSRTLCCGCRQPPADPQVTSCFHIFCLACLKDLQHMTARRGHDQARCTECGEAYTHTQPCKDIETFRGRDTSTSAAESTKKSKKDDKLDWIGMRGEVLPSAKTRAVKAQVMNWLQEDPDVKIIIYTQFLEMIRILSKICETEDWPFCRYIGTMSHDSRDKSIKEFAESKEKKILLASLKCGGVGLNLTMSSRVICLEPYWNRSVEDQAFCRVFRIGQERETRMARLVVRNTIDASLMAMKERKQVEIDEVMESKDKLNVEDLMRLFGNVGEDGEGRPFIFPNQEGCGPEHLRLANIDDEDEERFMGNEE